MGEKLSLVIIGAGGHAKSCIDVIERDGRFNIAGLVGCPGEMGSLFNGYRVLWGDDNLKELAKLHSHAIIGVGQIKTSDVRARLYRLASRAGFKFPVITSPSAVVSRNAIIGGGTIVMHGAIINASSSIGENCIINSRALIEHDVVVESDCHISTGAILNGNVFVGAGSFIGSGAVVKEGVRLACNSLIGMGVSVKHSKVEKSHISKSEDI